MPKKVLELPADASLLLQQIAQRRRRPDGEPAREDNDPIRERPAAPPTGMLPDPSQAG